MRREPLAFRAKKVSPWSSFRGWGLVGSLLGGVLVLARTETARDGDEMGRAKSGHRSRMGQVHMIRSVYGR